MADHNSFPSHIHFIGIGGIGMSALAQYFRHTGATVTGSDRDPAPAVHEMLAGKGVQVLLGHRAQNVPADAELVVYSDAVTEGSEGFVERTAAQVRGVRTLSYFEALGEVSRDAFTIAVAGTHGKTTTTSMLAKILVAAGTNPTAIIGSIVKDFGSNFIAGDPKLFVVEACEYRDHILKLHPNILVITNLEWDHSDWFPNVAAVQHTFRQAIARLPGDGILVTNPHDPAIAPLLAETSVRVIDYTKESVPELKLIGEFNEMNARAAKAAACAYAPDRAPAVADMALAGFEGTWRRFEYKGTTPGGAPVYDDYAHHPTAIRSTLMAARAAFPDQHITVVFHPHLYTRTRDLMQEFAASFTAADHVLIAPIYAAREMPIPGVSSEALAAHIQSNGTDAVALATFDEIIQALAHTGPTDLVITMGAGDVYKVAEQLVH